MKGRLWLLLGAAFGIAVAIGHIPGLAGAARSLSDSTQHLVGSGGARVISAVAKHGASQRAVLALTALVAIVVPGITALLLILAARGTMVLRRVVALLTVVIGLAGYIYQPGRTATAELALALAVAGLAVVASGPLVIAPLAALATLLGAEYLPRLLAAHSTLPNAPTEEIHNAVWGAPGNPLVLRVGVLIVACVPFALAARRMAKK